MPNFGTVTELFGREGSGKTQFLLNLIATCILPSTWKGQVIEGLAVDVVYIDTDFHFSLIRFIGILENRIKMKMQENLFKTDADELISMSLQRLHFIRCHNSFQLLTSLYSLEQLLMKSPQISLLIIDSISAFYWLDRMSQLDVYDNRFSSSRLAQIADLLKRLTVDYNLLTFVTKAAFMERREHPLDSAAMEHKSENEQFPIHFEYLGQQWQACVNNRLKFVKKFVVHMDLIRSGILAQPKGPVFSITVDKGIVQLCKPIMHFVIVDIGINYE